MNLPSQQNQVENQTKWIRQLCSETGWQGSAGLWSGKQMRQASAFFLKDFLDNNAEVGIGLLFSHSADSLWPRGLWAQQAPLSVRFFRQECWSGLPFPSPGIFLNQGLNPCLYCRKILYQGLNKSAGVSLRWGNKDGSLGKMKHWEFVGKRRKCYIEQKLVQRFPLESEVWEV